MAKKTTKTLREELMNPEPVKITSLPSSCTLLNLLLSDNIKQGFDGGTIISLTGEKHSGKSLIAGSILAGLAYDKNFDDYELIYHDTENGFKFDKEQFFGKKGAKRIQEPELEKEDENAPQTVLDFAVGMKNAINKNKPFVYVIDSLDALSTPDDIKKTDEVLDAYKKGSETSGTYGMAKAKFFSNFFNQITKPLENTNSLLIMVSQTRDNVNGMAGKTRSGGKAVGFYANTELWLAPPMKGSKIMKTVNGKQDQIGSVVEINNKKNRISGKPRKIKMTLYNGYGIDDITTTIEWLKEYGYMNGTAKLSIEGIDFEGTKEAFIRYIEDNNLEGKLAEVLQTCWDDRESKLEVKRKPKYDEEE